ncbi:hypothetical protein BABINDRAFT_167275 [Babjeviella inositovora NRRL Y-12698]|uniref:Ubiquitin-conjugating enzyme E2C-binding protein n=1 Tax=Babjeviella inositovora NRRL Y-12698 TaxID=984486 RepID=A0A1E3QP36_9ASCO|nr:uncharacterized protein BABINDRAFT_167275 [Babjeviella inositovora NRRL Y-12698]ODQ79410.1 hypothetical protein BABINDRAFT_167275 [Babjeviella inositovora NRRL Y-12698]
MTYALPIKYSAEFLPRLKSITVNIEITDASYIPTQAVMASPTVCSVTFGDLTSDAETTYQLSLPHPAMENLPVLSLIRKDVHNDLLYSIKLPAAATVEDSKYFDRSANFSMTMATDHVKWSTKDIKAKLSGSKLGFTFNCGKCNATILIDTQVTAFHDLPSELWLEMMDFWHCHKPETGEIHGTANRYTKLRPRANGVIIGSYYLLTNADDFPSITVVGDAAQCTACAYELGNMDDDLLVKLFKWNLILVVKGSEEMYLPYYHAYGVMLDAINSQASRVYQVKNESEESEMLVWVFNVGINLTLSGRELTNCLKIMYMRPGDGYREEIERRRDGLEVIGLSEVVYKSLVETLDDVHENLPQCQDQFMGWNVSYLSEK